MSDDPNPWRALANKARELARQAAQQKQPRDLIKNLLRTATSLDAAAAEIDPEMLGLPREARDEVSALSQPELAQQEAIFISGAKALTDANKARSMENMAQPQSAEQPRRRGRPLKSKHIFPRTLEARGTNVAEWATRHKVPRETAKSWHSRPPAGRPIPPIYAKLIEKEYGIPATEQVWRNGIR